MQLPSCKKKKKNQAWRSLLPLQPAHCISPYPLTDPVLRVLQPSERPNTCPHDLHSLISLKAQYRGDYSLQRCVHSYYVNLGFLSAVLPKNNWKHLHSKNSITFAFLPTPRRRGSGANPFTLHWKETWGLEPSSWFHLPSGQRAMEGSHPSISKVLEDKDLTVFLTCIVSFFPIGTFLNWGIPSSLL